MKNFIGFVLLSVLGSTLAEIRLLGDNIQIEDANFKSIPATIMRIVPFPENEKSELDPSTTTSLTSVPVVEPVVVQYHNLESGERQIPCLSPPGLPTIPGGTTCDPTTSTTTTTTSTTPATPIGNLPSLPSELPTLPNQPGQVQYPNVPNAPQPPAPAGQAPPTLLPPPDTAGSQPQLPTQLPSVPQPPEGQSPSLPTPPNLPPTNTASPPSLPADLPSVPPSLPTTTTSTAEVPRIPVQEVPPRTLTLTLEDPLTRTYRTETGDFVRLLKLNRRSATSILRSRTSIPEDLEGLALGVPLPLPPLVRFLKRGLSPYASALKKTQNEKPGTPAAVESEPEASSSSVSATASASPPASGGPLVARLLYDPYYSYGQYGAYSPYMGGYSGYGGYGGYYGGMGGMGGLYGLGGGYYY